jgi:hypothetical protein
VEERHRVALVLLKCGFERFLSLVKFLWPTAALPVLLQRLRR